MILRRATYRDLGKLLMVAGKLTGAYPMKPDADRMKRLGIEMTSGAAHFAMVAEDRGTVCACLFAYTGDNAWAQRKFSQVMLWWSGRPGFGYILLRAYKEWIQSRRAIKVAGFSPDIDLPLDTLTLMERTGFVRHGGSYLLYN